MSLFAERGWISSRAERDRGVSPSAKPNNEPVARPMYHAAPRSRRRSIERHGLDSDRGSGWGLPGGHLRKKVREVAYRPTLGDPATQEAFALDPLEKQDVQTCRGLTGNQVGHPLPPSVRSTCCTATMSPWSSWTRTISP